MSADPISKGANVGISHVRVLAQTDPVPVLSTRLGQLAVEARKQLDAFVSTLRELDRTYDTLSEHGFGVTLDLGPIGNAAAAARRDLDRDTGHKFELPR